MCDIIMKPSCLLLTIIYHLINNGCAFPKFEISAEETLSSIDSKQRQLERQVLHTAKQAKLEMERKLWGLHDQLENRIRDLARHLEHDCRKRALKYLSDALDEVEKNGMACRFAKELSEKMDYVETEARSVVTALRLQAQDLKLKFIPCLNREMASPYCSRSALALEKLSRPAQAFTDKAAMYFEGDYERFLRECFDKTAFEMKVQAGIVESQKCKGV